MKKGSLRITKNQSSSITNIIRQLITFNFPNVFPGTSVVTRSFRLTSLVNNGEVIVSQRRAAGSTVSPAVRYQFVNAVTGVPVSNSVTIFGTRIVRLPFTLFSGSVRLRITNVGTGRVAVEGVILVFL